MDIQLHEKYKKVLFPRDSELMDMYIEIREQDAAMMKVFRYIGKQQSQAGTAQESGLTINDLIENIQVDRLVKKQKNSRKFKYEQALTNLHRKTAERIIDKLNVMSLIYYKSVKPYKFIFLTERGKQLLVRIIELKTKQKEMNMNG